jgi:hypothetical protein
MTWAWTYTHELFIRVFLIGYLVSLPFGARYGIALTFVGFWVGFNLLGVDGYEGTSELIGVLMPFIVLLYGVGLLMGKLTRWRAGKFGKKHAVIFALLVLSLALSSWYGLNAYFK